MTDFQKKSCTLNFSQVKCLLFVTFTMRNTIISALRKLKRFYIITSLFQISHFVYFFHFHHSYWSPSLCIQQNACRSKYKKAGAVGERWSTFLHERTKHLPFRETVVKNQSKLQMSQWVFMISQSFYCNLENTSRRSHAKWIGIFF